MEKLTPATAQYVAGLREWLRQVDAEDSRSAGLAQKQPSAASATSATPAPAKTPSTQTSSTEAVTAKDKGNDFFKRKDYKKAVEWYTRSIDLDPMNAITVANRAMAYLQLKEYATSSDLVPYAAAEADSDQAIALDPSYVKAYMRRGTARRALGKLEPALEDFAMVLRLEKENKQAAQESAAIRQLIATKRQEEEKAKKEAEERKRRFEEEQLRKAQEKENEEKRRKAAEPTQRGEQTSQAPMNGGQPKQEEQSLASKPTEPTPARPAANQSPLSSSTILALSSPSSPVQFTKPKTVFEFERTWSNIKEDSQAFYRYFSMLEPKSYAQFFGNSMTPAIISSIVEALSKHGIESNFPHSLEVLRHLPSVRRWRIILKKEDREALKLLFERMRGMAQEGKSGGVPLDAVDGVRSLNALS